jgi:PAS domain S-box-containing protein
MKADRDQSAARLAAIVESSDDAIVSKDLDGYVTSWNAAAEQMFGYTAAEIIGHHITTIIPVERHPEEDYVLGRIRAGLRTEHFETVRQRKDGSLIDISLTVSPIRSSAGEIIGASKIARDITEAKALRRAAAEANRAKDEFLATLSHELRTPLNTLLGYTQMLQAGSLDQAAARRALEAMARNGQALAHLVDDVLDASRIVTGQMRLHLQPIQIRPILEEAVETIRPAMLAKSLELEMSVQNGLLVNADPDRMRQIMWNLLSNAVKFTPAGKVTLRAWRTGNAVRIDVTDTGIGIPAEALPRVFDRFWQANATHSSRHGGLGLGLSLVHYFVELQGGRVTAHSQGPGQGACFEIELPALGGSAGSSA